MWSIKGLPVKSAAHLLTRLITKATLSPGHITVRGRCETSKDTLSVCAAVTIKSRRRSDQGCVALFKWMTRFRRSAVQHAQRGEEKEPTSKRCNEEIQGFTLKSINVCALEQERIITSSRLLNGSLLSTTTRLGGAHAASPCVFSFNRQSDERNIKRWTTRIKHTTTVLVPLGATQGWKPQRGLLSNPGQAWESGL